MSLAGAVCPDGWTSHVYTNGARQDVRACVRVCEVYVHEAQAYGWLSPRRRGVSGRLDVARVHERREAGCACVCAECACIGLTV